MKVLAADMRVDQRRLEDVFLDLTAGSYADDPLHNQHQEEGSDEIISRPGP